MSGIVDVFGAIVTVALITTIVAHPQSAGVIRAIGDAFSKIYVGGIKAALGH